MKKVEIINGVLVVDEQQKLCPFMTRVLMPVQEKLRQGVGLNSGLCSVACSLFDLNSNEVGENLNVFLHCGAGYLLPVSAVKDTKLNSQVSIPKFNPCCSTISDSSARDLLPKFLNFKSSDSLIQAPKPS